MSRHRFNVEVEIDDDELAAEVEIHARGESPLDADPSKWTVKDLLWMIGRPAVVAAELVNYERDEVAS